MNRSLLIRIATFAALAVGLGAGWWFIDKTFFPKPEAKAPNPPRECLLAITGIGATTTSPADTWPLLTQPEPPKSAIPPETPKPSPPVVSPPAPKPSDPTILVALGSDKFYQQILLTNRGAAVQQAILPSFDESTREGRDAKDEAGNVRRLHLIPGITGVSTPDGKRASIFDKTLYPDLKAGPIKPGSVSLSEPSYTLLHYPSVGDPLLRTSEGAEQYPSTELADRLWKIVDQSPSADGSEARVVFETALAAPYFLKIRKTFTLGPKDYHVGMKLDFEALPGRPDKDRVKFKYQISGARGLPVEGEWYTSTYRNSLVGWVNPAGTAKRDIQDSASITTSFGGNRIDPQGNTFTYAGVGTQYFASVLAIDESMPDEARKNLWHYVRPSREPQDSDMAEKPQLGDITVRVAANPIDPQADKPVSHSYLIYNGPIKVRLLGQLDDSKGTVDPALVDRYLDKLTLRTLADYHSPSFFGRLANSIYWADIVIWMTNRMHGILAFLHGIVPIWGVDILLLTVMVRMLLFLTSRKQQQVMAKTQEKMAALKPEIAKLEEKYKGDYQRFNQERTKLMVLNGVNPLSSMSGCVLMFAQLPVFMGLYFCLQESIFFRLESFLWFPNLAAPDMLVKFGEGVPWISEFSSIGGSVYLGPYLNILPLIAVSLMFVHQKMTLPPPTDEQQEMQQRMMKIMMIVMAVFFYKMAAGMCLYFIASTAWGLTERKLIKRKNAAAAAAGGPTTLNLTQTTATALSTSGAKAAPAAPVAGGFLSRLKAKIEEIQQQSDTTRQIRNDPKAPAPPGAPKPNGTKPNGKKKKKK